MITSAQVAETSVTTTDNSHSQDYTHPNDTILSLIVIFDRRVYGRREKHIVLYIVWWVYVLEHNLTPYLHRNVK